jgi:pimeloyl-ACP methyl ester carboxylesterase
MRSGGSRRARLAALIAAVLTAGTAAASAPTQAADPTKDPTYYCDGSLDGGATGAITDYEHRVLVGEPPFPRDLRRRTVTIDGVRTRVIEGGRRRAKEAVVFVHGHPGSPRDFDGLMTAAAKLGTRVVSFDAPGFGRAADGPNRTYSTDSAARFIDRALAKLGVKQAHMVLHDFGGPWALTWAMRHNDRMPSVVLINTGVMIGYYGHAIGNVWHTPIAGELHMATATRDQFHAYANANNPRPLPPRFLDRMYDDWDRGTRCAALGYYRSIENPDAMGRRQAAALRKRPNRPALVIWGTGDTYLPVSMAKRQREAFPRAQIHRVPDAGHWPFVDRPKLVRSLVIPFLERVTR